MSAHVLLNLLNELRKRYKMRGLSSILSFFVLATILIKSIMQEHELLPTMKSQFLRENAKILPYIHDICDVITTVNT